jgi:hypothetical protein
MFNYSLGSLEYFRLRANISWGSLSSSRPSRKKHRLGMLLGLGVAFPGGPVSDVIEYHAPHHWLYKQEVEEFFIRQTSLCRILKGLKRTSLYSNLSLDVACHEGSHALAFHLLHDVKELRLKVHRWEMLRDLGRGPREDMKTLLNFLMGGGPYASGGHVRCSYEPGFLGSILGRKACELLIRAAGTAGELGLALLLYWAGRRSRHKPMRAGMLQTLSCGMAIEALEYPWLLRYGRGDWSVISRMTGLPTWVLALGLSCAYALAALGVYALGRETKRTARRKAFSRLLDPYFVDKLADMIPTYVRGKPRLVKLLERFPMGKGFASFLHRLERRKRENELLRYGIAEFKDFEARERLLRKRVRGVKLPRRIWLRRVASKLESLRDRVIDNFLATETEARELVESEVRLYDLLVKGYERFEEDPEGFAARLSKLGFEAEQERLKRFYEGNGSALQVLRTKSPSRSPRSARPNPPRSLEG